MALVQIADLSAAPFPLSGGELLEIDTKLESYKVKVDNLLSAYDHQDLDAISRQNAFVGLENVLQLSGGPFVQVLDSENIGSIQTTKGRKSECIVFDNGNALIDWSDSDTEFSYVVVSGSGPENIGFVKSKSDLATNVIKGAGGGVLLNSGYEAGFMIPVLSGGVAVMTYYKIDSSGEKILDDVVVFENETGSNSLATSYVKALPNGNLIVFFRDFDTSGGPLTFVITDDDGKILINKTVVTTDIPSFKGLANYNTTVLPNGNIIVAWRSNDSTKLAKAAMYSQHGDLLIPETILFNTNRTASSDSVFKVMAFSNGNWLLSYINPSGQDVLYRIYDQTFNLIKNEQVAMDFSVNLGSGTIGKARTFNNQVVLIRNMTVGGPTASYMVFIDSKGNIRQTEINIWGSNLNDNGENLNLQGNTLDGKLYITKMRDSGSDNVYLDIWTGSSPFQSGIHDITNGSATATITFDPPLPDSNYRLILELVNTVDSPPTVYSMVVESKSKTGFTVRLSGSVDSGNFELHWSAFSVKNTVISSGA